MGSQTSIHPRQPFFSFFFYLILCAGWLKSRSFRNAVFFLVAVWLYWFFCLIFLPICSEKKQYLLIKRISYFAMRCLQILSFPQDKVHVGHNKWRTILPSFCLHQSFKTNFAQPSRTWKFSPSLSLSLYFVVTKLFTNKSSFLWQQPHRYICLRMVPSNMFDEKHLYSWTFWKQTSLCSHFKIKR